jgi:hypothetical protein
MKLFYFTITLLLFYSCKSSKAGCDAYGQFLIDQDAEYVQVISENGTPLTDKVPTLNESFLNLNLPSGNYTVLMYSDGKVLDSKKIKL